MSTATKRATTRRGQTAAILPSAEYPSKPGYFSDDEFAAALLDERDRLLAAGRALVDHEWRDRRATMRKDER